MGQRIGFTVAICLGLASAAAGQVVRFETSVGDFDMVLNPTHNEALQGYVDNMLLYVKENRYVASWINRAPTGFVLQMGGFYSNTLRPSLTIDSVRSIAPFAPAQGHPAAEIGLSNTVGTVSLALPGDGFGGTDRDAGTSSFFVNLGDNSFLDSDFTVFAMIPDMTVINSIMALSKIDRTVDEKFGADPGNLALTDVPVQANGFQVFLKRAFVISDALAVAKDLAGIQSALALSKSAAGAGDDLSPAFSLMGDGANAGSPFLSQSVVPEPNGVLLATIGLLGAGRAFRRRRS